MRLTSFEQSYTKQTPVTWQGHKITPKKITKLESTIETQYFVCISKFGELPL